jgi:hypothetical protein
MPKRDLQKCWVRDPTLHFLYWKSAPDRLSYHLQYKWESPRQETVAGNAWLLLFLLRFECFCVLGAGPLSSRNCVCLDTKSRVTLKREPSLPIKRTDGPIQKVRVSSLKIPRRASSTWFSSK